MEKSRGQLGKGNFIFRIYSHGIFVRSNNFCCYVFKFLNIFLKCPHTSLQKELIYSQLVACIQKLVNDWNLYRSNGVFSLFFKAMFHYSIHGMKNFPILPSSHTSRNKIKLWMIKNKTRPDYEFLFLMHFSSVVTVACYFLSFAIFHVPRMHIAKLWCEQRPLKIKIE